MDKFAFHFEKQFMAPDKTFYFKIMTGLMLSAVVFLSDACKNEDCVSVFNNDLLVSFITTDTLEDGKVEIHPKDTVFYSIVAEGNDTVFYDKNDTRSIFALPVNPAGEATKFIFQVIDSIRYDTLSLDPLEIDTLYFLNPDPHILSVSYVRRERIITEDCGVEIGYFDIEITGTTFPDATVVADRLDRFNEANIEILF